jgi:putative two-component system response regulator
LEENDFDVVLLDKYMPGMDGDEVCYRIRNDLNLPLLPIIMITGSADQNDLVKSMRVGATDFMHKPYSPLELVARVSAAASHKRLLDQLDSAESLLFALARGSVVFGTALGLNEEQLLALRRGGVLHDIGKLGIPDSILLKNGPLTDEEWVLMRQHTVIGARLCSGLNSMKLTVPIIRHHHERWDGSGYPDGLKGEEIPYLARIFQIVDVYDALASVRPYKPAWPHEKIIAAMEEETRKGWRDPELMAVFLDILHKRPEDLLLPENSVDLGAQIFEDIMATGTLSWNKKRKSNG